MDEVELAGERVFQNGRHGTIGKSANSASLLTNATHYALTKRLQNACKVNEKYHRSLKHE